MRHGKKFNHLGRTASHRRALLSNLAISLITHKRINTTVAKAKALQKYIEPLLTKSKTDDTNNRRVVFSYLQDKEAVTELFRTVAPKIANRPGGYTRIIKTGFRLGDSADMAMIELVDFNDIYTNAKVEKKQLHVVDVRKLLKQLKKHQLLKLQKLLKKLNLIDYRYEKGLHLESFFMS